MKFADTTAVADSSSIDDDVAWDAVLKRDRSFDGAFVYGVRTTGIYCRPSCPSRRPNRTNATILQSCGDAETAGYRACLRCHPRSEEGTPLDRSVRKAAAYIEANVDEVITLDRLAKHVGLSPYHLQRTFKKRVGVSPRRYQSAVRMKRMRKELRARSTVSRAIFEAGFGSVRGAYEQAPTGLGMTPGEYRKGGTGLSISYTLSDSPHGRLLVGATSVGVCVVSLGDDDDTLIQEMAAEFPGAECTRDDDQLRAWLDMILAGLDGTHPGLALPLDLHGTAFQVKVWRALQEIPVGETRSYAEVANAVGSPGAARAVAQACASNKAAMVVPCHRVIRSDGSLSGYRWGVERKKALLESESATRQALGFG